MNTLARLSNHLRLALEALDRPRVEFLFTSACELAPPLLVAEQVVAPALIGLGEDWQAGRLALSQVYMSSRICEQLIERVLPPSAAERKDQPRHAIVVLSDYHQLGKRIVLSVMRASGFEILDYGRMEPDALVERVQAERLRILLISVLMLPSALKIKAVRAALAARHVEVRIAVGGAPFLFDPQLWREVGADAMGHDAAEAVAIVSRWMKELA